MSVDVVKTAQALDHKDLQGEGHEQTIQSHPPGSRKCLLKLYIAKGKIWEILSFVLKLDSEKKKHSIQGAVSPGFKSSDLTIGPLSSSLKSPAKTMAFSWHSKRMPKQQERMRKYQCVHIGGILNL